MILDNQKLKERARKHGFSVREVLSISRLSEEEQQYFIKFRFAYANENTINLLSMALWCDPEQITGERSDMEKHLKGLKTIIAADPEGLISGTKVKAEAEALENIISGMEHR